MYTADKVIPAPRRATPLQVRAALRASVLAEIDRLLATGCDCGWDANRPSHVTIKVGGTSFRVLSTRERLDSFRKEIGRCGGFSKQRTARDVCKAQWASNGLRGSTCDRDVNGFAEGIPRPTKRTTSRCVGGVWRRVPVMSTPYTPDSADEENLVELRSLFGD